MGYTDYEFNNSLDSDYSPLKLLNRGRNEQHEQFSAELDHQLAKRRQVRVLWLALSIQTEELSNDRLHSR